MSKKEKEEVTAPGVYKEPEGLIVALPSGNGWTIHVDENGKIEVEGPILLV